MSDDDFLYKMLRDHRVYTRRPRVTSNRDKTNRWLNNGRFAFENLSRIIGGATWIVDRCLRLHGDKTLQEYLLRQRNHREINEWLLRQLQFFLGSEFFTTMPLSEVLLFSCLLCDCPTMFHHIAKMHFNSNLSSLHPHIRLTALLARQDITAPQRSRLQTVLAYYQLQAPPAFGTTASVL